ncbi:hypothetical protein Bca4012_020455 [Brassica carinata]
MRMNPKTLVMNLLILLVVQISNLSVVVNSLEAYNKQYYRPEFRAPPNTLVRIVISNDLFGLKNDGKKSFVCTNGNEVWRKSKPGDRYVVVQFKYDGLDTVAFDPNKPHSLDYVRVRVFFDVSRPVRKSKVVNLPCGGTGELRFDFERLQKRCYNCQRLTHEKDKCPLLIQARKDQDKERKQRILAEKQSRERIILSDDPLYGVLSESQVGVDPSTGRRKINPEVLQNMREYLIAAEGGERRVREERVTKSVEDLANDPRAQKSFLWLEPALALTCEVNQGKGLTFNYPENEMTQEKSSADV